MDQTDNLENFLSLLEHHQIRFCVIGGQAVNAYVDPLVSLDLNLAVAIEQLDQVEALLRQHYRFQRFPHNLNIEILGSDVRIQLQTDERYGDFVAWAKGREVLGLMMPVANLEDVLQGKIWVVQDVDRRASKRQKDLADIARILEAYPERKARVRQMFWQN